MRIIGDCETEGRVRIQGKVSGTVTARGVELTSTGLVAGDLVTPKKDRGDQVFIVDGTVEGSVSAKRVEVQRNGSVRGGIEADDAAVHGSVLGGIVARNRLALSKTASVEGDVRAGTLVLEEGGQVNGTIRMGDLASLDADTKDAKSGKSEKSEKRGKTDKGSDDADRPELALVANAQSA